MGKRLNASFMACESRARSREMRERHPLVLRERKRAWRSNRSREVKGAQRSGRFSVPTGGASPRYSWRVADVRPSSFIRSLLHHAAIPNSSEMWACCTPAGPV